jgi:uncharacterized membrane protein YjgN (DUF898 family)
MMSETASITGSPWRGPDLRPVSFIGGDKEFWRIVMRGAALLMVTLGLYRFWLATDVRRFLWSNTIVDGDALEYTGTAIELLRGFLVAIALLLPIYTIFVITVLDLGPLGGLLSGSAVLLLVFLSQYGIYLARRYRLTRTVYRGLRFHQTGSALRYSICAVWWWAWTVLTLGFAYPFTRAALERFRMRHTYYGDLPGRFEASGWALFVRGFLIWLIVLIPLLGALAILASIDWPSVTAAMRGEGNVIARLERASPGFTTAIGGAVVFVAVALLFTALLLPAFHAIVVRWWISGLRFGAISAKSHLRIRDVYGIYFRYLAYVLLFGAIMLAGVFVALVAYGLTFGQQQSELSEIFIVLIMVGTYVVSALGILALYQSVVTLSVWRLAAASLELQGNPAILGRVNASGVASSPLGEGIADVLNIGGI